MKKVRFIRTIRCTIHLKPKALEPTAYRILLVASTKHAKGAPKNIGVPFLVTKSYGQRAQSLQCMVDLSFYYLLFSIDYTPPFNWLQSVVR